MGFPPYPEETLSPNFGPPIGCLATSTSVTGSYDEATAALSKTVLFSDKNPGPLGSLGFVYPYPVYRGSLVLAAGLTRIKDFDWSLNLKGDDQGLAADHALQHEGELALAGVSAAIDVSSAVSLGATLGLVSGEDEAVNEFDWADLQNEFDEQRFLARDSFTDEYQWTPYAVLGVMLRTPRDKPRYRLGATFATGGTHKIRYVFRGSPSDTGYSSVEYDDGTVEEFSDEEARNTYELALPFEFGVGASAEALPGLTLAGSLHLAEWSQSEYEGDDDGLRADTSFETQYRDVLRYHVGVEYRVPVVALDLRAGYFVDPVPFIGPRDPDSDDPPIRIEEDRRFITLGAGILIDEAMQIDLAWVRGAFKQVEEYSDEYSDNVLSEDYAINRLVVGLSYNF